MKQADSDYVLYEERKTAEIETALLPSFRKRLVEDVVFRRKVILSAALYGLFACLGWNVSQLGPSLLDLQQITQSNLDEISYILVAFSVGFVVGVVLVPFLMKKVNTIMTLISMNVIIAIATAVTPWCDLFGVMVVILALRGIFHGVNDAGCNVLVLKIWGKDNGPYMQALHFSFAIGAVISPLAMAPFLTTSGAIDNSTMSYNCSNYFSDSGPNETYPVLDCNGDNFEESIIHGAFIMSAALLLLSAMSFSYFICTQDYSSTEKHSGTQRIQTDMTNVERSGTIATICCAFFIAMVLEKIVIFYLPTFVVEHLHWQKVQGSYAMSAFWGAFAFGRLLGIVITKRFKVRHILGAYLFVLVIASVGLMTTNTFKISVGIWIFVPCLGFFQSTLFPCLMTWTEVEFFKVSGRLVSLFMVCGSVGAMCTPIALGYLIDLHSPMWFCYTLVAFSLLMFVVYLLMLFIASKIRIMGEDVSIYIDT